MSAQQQNQFRLAAASPECHSIVLASHGSDAYRRANQPQFELAKALQSRGSFARVTPAFLQGNPSLADVFDDLPPGNVTVVPLMTSEGYYVRQVLPSEMGKHTDLTPFRIRITSAIGIHPRLGSLVGQRAETLMREHQVDPGHATILLIGHGTRRNRRSGDSTYNLANHLNRYLDCPVEVGFLDQDPTIEAALSEVTSGTIVALPFLMGLGPHVTDDIPRELNLAGGPDVRFPMVGHRNNQTIICDQPIGTCPGIADLCFDLATTGMTNELAKVDHES